MGAHPSAPSVVHLDGRERPLDELLAAEPGRFLREAAAGDGLPCLMKILAIDAPLPDDLRGFWESLPDMITGAR